MTDEQDGTPLFPVRVSPFLFPGGYLLRATRSVAGGVHTSVALPPGTYGAVVSGVGGYLEEYYLEAASLAEADSFSVVRTSVTPAIDFTLARDPVDTGGSEAPPTHLMLEEPQPNPFSSQTSVSYAVPAPCGVRLAVHDTQGRLVRVLVDEVVPRGAHRVAWDGKDGAGRYVGSGVYLITLESQSTSSTRHAVLMR